MTLDEFLDFIPTDVLANKICTRSQVAIVAYTEPSNRKATPWRSQVKGDQRLMVMAENVFSIALVETEKARLRERNK